jgi:hypothetical protein
MMQLRLLDDPLRPDQLPAILNDHIPEPASTLSSFEASIEPIVLLAESATTRTEMTRLESDLAPLLHRTLDHLPRRYLLDPALWNWLAIGPLRPFVIMRWYGGRNPEVGSAIAAKDMIRWNLTPSLRGFANHAVARLFWAAQHLGPNDDYALTRAVLDKEDLFKQVFDRELCLHDPAARACVAHYANGEEAEWRRGIKSLNLVLSTTSVEYLDEAEILELLNSFDSMDEQ